jgi:hypothetical protein
MENSLVNKIKSFFKNDRRIETEKFLIAQKSCPHCASRGMFIFNDAPVISTTISEVELKDQCQSELVED